MKTHRKKVVIGFAILVLVGVLLTPAALRAIPPRYAARWLPEPLLEIASPQQEVAILPTVVQPLDANSLLGEPTPLAAPVVELVQPTATQTLASEETAIPPTAVPPTATPVPTATAVPIPAAARLEGIQHHFQDWNNCGPATLAMTLSYFDLFVTQSDTAAVLKPNPEDRNVSPDEMAAYVNETTQYEAIYRVNGRIDMLKQFVANGIPVIMEIGIEPPGEFRWLGWYGHYLLVVAYDDANEQFFVYDSWFGTSDVPLENADRNGRNLPYAEVETFWPQFNRSYIAVYEPEQAETVARIIGEDMDDATMWEKSLVQAQAEAASDPTNAFYWFNLGSSYNAAGEYERASTAFDQARAIGLPWRMLWYQFGPYEAYYEVGRYEDVILLADVTLQDRPYFEESFYYKGLALAATGETAAAEENLERATTFNPNFAPAVVALAELSSNQ
ncbi:C39 family peptidase [Candidatus Leptofilum sp.]|uniref:C39 family peptidase n=1 Tax=Candidatus Leptofilum sp. TaxID=3241576 RepID=UPI003B5D036A